VTRTREAAETVIAAYRPKPGKDRELRKLIHEHRRTLADAQLVTHRRPLILRARSDGTLLEIFEWASAKAADRAHRHAPIRAMWRKLSEVADFVALSDIKEAGKAFSHFEALAPESPRVRTLAAERPAVRQPKR
jgi:hypothetical protein